MKKRVVFGRFLLVALIAGVDTLDEEADFEPGHFAGKYIYHSVPKTWDEAAAMCAIQGSYLAVINSPEEEVEVFNLITVLGVPRSVSSLVFIGFHDRNYAGVYETVLGRLLNNVNIAWDEHQPDNVGSERCGAMSPGIRFHDVDCQVQQPFLCERFEKPNF